MHKCFKIVAHICIISYSMTLNNINIKNKTKIKRIIKKKIDIDTENNI